MQESFQSKESAIDMIWLFSIMRTHPHAKAVISVANGKKATYDSHE